ncbi:hypothetical protein [Carboxylicivirga caseinilyticus]|uniref:hypothetical protein n=1 Tax=Carboxylicivirga caseinilyticus TaxID=3417572 RepID=UPI003D334BD9|nr:hypothetical protein [Marinilabiliaceae bacterium A049]
MLKYFPTLLALSFIFTINSYAQYELKLKLDYPPLELKLDPFIDFEIDQLELSQPSVLKSIADTISLLPNLQLDSKTYIAEFNVYHRQKFNSYFALGAYDWTNAEKKADLWDNTTFWYGFGLLKTFSLMNPTEVQYQYTLNLELNQPINNWLSLRSNAHYISKPIYKFNNANGSLFHMNPLFMQSDVAASLQAQYNNVKIDVGFRSIFNTQSKNSSPINMINTKMSVIF